MAGIAAAIPGIPHQFYGSVLVNGAPAPDGTTIVAKIDGSIVGTTVTAGGRYGYAPSVFYIEDPNSSNEGKTFYFYVSNVEAATAVFHNAASSRLDLSVSIAQPPQNTGGSSGGGSSGYIPPAQPKNTTNSSQGNAPACHIDYDFTMQKNEFSAMPGSLVTVPININMKDDCGAPRDLQFTLESQWINFTRVEKLVGKGTTDTSLFFQIAEGTALGDYSGKITSAGAEQTFTVHVAENITEAGQTGASAQRSSQGISITGFFAGIGSEPVATGAVILIIIIIALVAYYSVRRARKKQAPVFSERPRQAKSVSRKYDKKRK